MDASDRNSVIDECIAVLKRQGEADIVRELHLRGISEEAKSVVRSYTSNLIWHLHRLKNDG